MSTRLIRKIDTSPNIIGITSLIRDEPTGPSISKFLDDFFPSSKYLVEIAESMYQENEFADLASFKPLYLKDFVPTTSKS